MANHQELPVYKATYDMTLTIFEFVKDFAKEYKYSVGEALKRECMELTTLIFRANGSQAKGPILQEARERIEVIRLYVRLMRDLHQVSVKKFVHLNLKVEQVSRQLTGWQKHTQPLETG
jgi:hypothetical protein